jgi:hypothetical protein
VFNNIAWGLSNDPTSPLVNCAAFQEIISHQNDFFNNTAYNFFTGSRRQAPHAGRNKFVGQRLAEHQRAGLPSRRSGQDLADGNAAHAGPQKQQFAYETNAYADGTSSTTSARWASSNLRPLARIVGRFPHRVAPAADPGVRFGRHGRIADAARSGRGDFRLNRQSAAVDRGAVVFVPWALYGVVAEWNFYPAGNDHRRRSSTSTGTRRTS